MSFASLATTCDTYPISSGPSYLKQYVWRFHCGQRQCPAMIVVIATSLDDARR
jgi:hypothetical protein